MRVDKFLKVSRLVKRRTVAKEMCLRGGVFINGRPAKPGTPVQVGDQLDLRFPYRRLVVQVRRVSQVPRREAADPMFTVLSEETLE